MTRSPASRVLLFALVLALAGCRTRRYLEITTNPPGAEVRLDDERVGITPVKVPFEHFGVRRVTFYKPGYQTTSRRIKLRAPWYARFPLDIVSEVLLPMGLRDRRKVHQELVATVAPNVKAPATTLTLVLLLWPRAYLIHVGDSRAYVRRRGRVQAMTRDQTFGEYMVSVGAWSEDQAGKFRTAETLASAIGGTEMTPTVGLIDLEPGDSLLLCTDGLTKHVAEERIAEVMGQSVDSKAMAETLLGDALNGGGVASLSDDAREIVGPAGECGHPELRGGDQVAPATKDLGRNAFTGR